MAGFEAGLVDHRLADSPAQIYELVGRELADHHREVLQRRLGVPGLGRLLPTLAG